MPSFIILGYVRQILGRGLFAASKRLILNRVQAWLEKGSNLKTVHCKLCHHSFDVSNMGRNFLPILFFNANNTELPNLVNSTPPKWSNGKSSSTVSLLPSDVQLKKTAYFALHTCPELTNWYSLSCQMTFQRYGDNLFNFQYMFI